MPAPNVCQLFLVFVSSVRFSLFKKHFPEITRSDKEWLRSTHTQFVKELKKKISTQVHKDAAKQNLPELLKGLDKIIDEADGKKDETAWYIDLYLFVKYLQFLIISLPKFLIHCSGGLPETQMKI